MARSGWSTRSRRERGYGPEWDRLRKRILERDSYLCQCKHCKAEGRTTLAHEVDHIVPKSKGGTDDPRNLQSINRDCHKRKTLEDEGRQPHERVRIGADGWPVSC
jgi:5-methylcytosine-specific restriction enzyme A